MCGAPGRIRTHDPLVRSQVLYPTELRARCGANCTCSACVDRPRFPCLGMPRRALPPQRPSGRFAAPARRPPPARRELRASRRIRDPLRLFRISARRNRQRRQPLAAHCIRPLGCLRHRGCIRWQRSVIAYFAGRTATCRNTVEATTRPLPSRALIFPNDSVHRSTSLRWLHRTSVALIARWQSSRETESEAAAANPSS